MSKINAFDVYQICPNGLTSDPTESSNTPFPYLMGVELELENTNTTAPPSGWVAHVDQSLRNGIEFVTNGPMAGSRLARVLSAYFNAGITADNSPRTSTHIHVNVSNMTIGQLRTMTAVSYMMETALFDIIGRSRKYCGYCMPLREMGPHRLRSFFAEEKWPQWVATLGGRNEDKYYGFNVSSVRKHGTAEFRYFPGGPSSEELNGWLSYCIGIKRVALNISFEDLIGIADADALSAVLREHMGPEVVPLIEFQGPEAMFNALQELVVLLPDPDNKMREDMLVFISEPVLKAVQNIAMATDRHKAWTAFVAEARRLGVTTMPTWRRMVSNMTYQIRTDVEEEEVTPPSAVPKYNRPSSSPAVEESIRRRRVMDSFQAQVNAFNPSPRNEEQF